MTGIDVFAIRFSSNPMLFMDKNLAAELEPIIEQKEQEQFEAGYQEGRNDSECQIESTAEDLEAAQTDLLYLKQEMKHIYSALVDGKPEDAAELLRDLLTELGEL